jgi:hypothetical protein
VTAAIAARRPGLPLTGPNELPGAWVVAIRFSSWSRVSVAEETPAVSASLLRKGDRGRFVTFSLLVPARSQPAAADSGTGVADRLVLLR